MAHLFIFGGSMFAMLLKDKLIALVLHLSFSFFLAVTLALVVFFIWFPGISRIFGAVDGILIFIGVDLVLGPLLTFVVYDRRKKELQRDIVLIVIIQLLVFLFGVWTINQQRPLVQVLTHKEIAIFSRADLSSMKIEVPDSIKESESIPYRVFMYLPENLSDIEKAAFVTEFIEQIPFGARTDLYRSFTQGERWGLSNLLNRFERNAELDCYWVNISSKHFVGVGCINAQGHILTVK